MKKLSVLGSTGSIGTQALSIIDGINVKAVAISGYSNVDLLEKQARQHSPKVACAVDESAAKELETRLFGSGIKVISGEEGLLEAAAFEECDTVLSSVVGMAGLKPTLEAIKAKKQIALANKETLVAGGSIVMKKAKEQGLEILPVDSEHSAIFQCLQGSGRKELRKIILTASGGPFFKRTKEQLEDITPEQALKHPNWSMGKKVTIDSATLMNKGLELIEAMWLFSMSPEDIEITVHRQSIVHSMVEFCDGSVIAQLGVPDMRLPIQYALTWPKRMPCPVEPLTIERMANLTFERPDTETFRCLSAAKFAAAKGGVVPAVLNAANEVAVEKFLNGEIRFLEIGEIAQRAVESAPKIADPTLEDILFADSETRKELKA